MCVPEVRELYSTFAPVPDARQSSRPESDDQTAGLDRHGVDRIRNRPPGDPKHWPFRKHARDGGRKAPVSEPEGLDMESHPPALAPGRTGFQPDMSNEPQPNRLFGPTLGKEADEGTEGVAEDTAQGQPPSDFDHSISDEPDRGVDQGELLAGEMTGEQSVELALGQGHDLRFPPAAGPASGHLEKLLLSPAAVSQAADLMRRRWPIGYTGGDPEETGADEAQQDDGHASTPRPGLHLGTLPSRAQSYRNANRQV